MEAHDVAQTAPPASASASFAAASPAPGRKLGLSLLVIATAQLMLVLDDTSDSGAAAGLLNTGIQVGAALGMSGLASIASVVTRSRLPGHTLAAALTDGYCSGLFAGAALFAIGAVVALAAINARIEAGEAQP